MQRPLYGIAVDLTPSAVFASAAEPLPMGSPTGPISAISPVAPVSPKRTAAPLTTVTIDPPLAPLRTRQAPTRAPVPDTAHLKAAAIAIAAVFLAWLGAATRTGPPRPAKRDAANAAQTVPVAVASAASGQGRHAAQHVPAAQASAPPPQRVMAATAATRSRAASPAAPAREHIEDDLTTTLERLRGGIR